MKFSLVLVLLVHNIAYGKEILIETQNTIQVKERVLSVLELAASYAKIKGYNFLNGDKVRGKVEIVGPQTFAKKDLDLFVSLVLSNAGYSLIRNEEIRQMEIIASRDVRYRPVPLIRSVADVNADYHYAQLVLPMKFADASSISRNMRPFISRYGRVIDDKNSNNLLITDTGKNLKRLAKLIALIDTKDFVENQKKVKELNTNNVDVTESTVPLMDFIKSEHVLFIIVFSLISLIIGFGVRGYMMKRIEGGW